LQFANWIASKATMSAAIKATMSAAITHASGATEEKQDSVDSEAALFNLGDKNLMQQMASEVTPQEVAALRSSLATRIKALAGT
jgi:hypothetical protein